MTRILYILLGMFVGSFFTMIFMCVLQINRINELENIIRSLQNKTGKTPSKLEI